VHAITREELQLATRNHGMPLEALQYPVTPVGLHYLLIHYDIPVLDAASWRLAVDGCVASPLELTIDDLRSMASVTRAVTMECAGNGRGLLDPRPASVPWLAEAVGTGEWTGVPLADALANAGLAPETVDVVFSGADRGVEGGVAQSYQRSIDAATASDPATGALLAYELNGAPLPPQHGFPLRLVVPRWYGMTSVKWLERITASPEPFAGYQQTTGYRIRHTDDEVGTLVTRMLPRSLMVPPGVPDFFTRTRIVQAGDHLLRGRAWSGHGAIASVDVSTDGGATWRAATVDGPDLGDAAWQAWTYEWRADPGEYELCSRATDTAGTEQPVTASWNTGGYTNNAVQRVPVRVES
jgi:DMSO/TMAO reductase YedYZ molybdopterin-dependent catalytic subunit